MDHGTKIYCMMNSGKQLTKTICDVLLFNAYDMFQEKRRIQRIKSSKYDGMIETNLEVYEWNGWPVVSYLANISTSEYENNEVQFVVRVTDFDGIPLLKWQQLEVQVGGKEQSLCGCEKCQDKRKSCGCRRCRFEMKIIERIEEQGQKEGMFEMDPSDFEPDDSDDGPDFEMN